MADTNPIRYEDLIKPDDSIEKLQKQLEDTLKIYQKMADTVVADSKRMADALKTVSGATSGGRKEISQASKEADELAKAQKALTKAESETAAEIARLKELTREQNAINKANAKQAMSAADSYDYLSAQYTKNKLILNKMSEEERANTKVGKELEEETKRIYERMNELQKATGKYTLQVGNYNIAGERMAEVVRKGKEELKRMADAGQSNTAAFRELAQQVANFKDTSADVDAMINTMASDTSNLDAVLQGMAVGTGGFAAVTGAMELFGGESKEVEEAQRKLQAAIALVNGVTAIQNALQKQSALVTKLKVFQDKVLSVITKQNTTATIANTAAIKAQGVATETTTKATKGLGKAMNALKSNPVILALSVIAALGVATVAIVKKVRAAQKEAYEQELKNLETTEAKRKAAMQTLETSISKKQQEIKLAQAEGKSEAEIMKLREAELQERSDMAARSTAWNKKELDNLEQNKQKLLDNQATLKAAEAEQIKLKKYKIEEIEAENALLERQIEIAEKQLETNRDLEVEYLAFAEEKRQLAIETAKAEEDSLRDLEDARNNLIKNQFKRERTITQANYDRQIADLKTRLENEKNLTAKQVENINALIVELDKTKNIEIEKINAQERAANLEAWQQTQTMWLSLQADGLQKERAQLRANYDKEANDLRTKLETDRDLTIEQRQAINVQLYLLYLQYLKDTAKLNEKARTDELNKELKSIELRKAALVGNQKQSTEDAMREIEIRRTLELQANKQLAEDLRQSEAEINAKYDAQRKTTADKMAKDIALEQLNIRQELAQSEYDLLKLSENKKTEIALQMQKERLEKELELNETAQVKMSDDEVKIIQNKIAKIDKEIEANRNKQSLLERLGINLSDEDKEAISESFDYAKSVLQDYLDYQSEIANRAVENSQRQVDAARDTLQAERDARAQGYANNVAMAEKELAAAKQQQKKALKQQQEAAKQQQKLQTIEQAVNLVTGTAKIIGQFGMPWSIPLIALMWGAFAASKIKAKQLESEQYGEGTVELLEGGSHASGNDIDLGVKKNGKRRRAEGGEYFAIINKKSSRKYGKQIPEIIDSLNKGVFAEKYANAYEGGNTIIATFDGKAELKSIASDMREMNERGKGTIVTYTVDGRIEKRGNITRIIKK